MYQFSKEARKIARGRTPKFTKLTSFCTLSQIKHTQVRVVLPVPPPQRLNRALPNEKWMEKWEVFSPFKKIQNFPPQLRTNENSTPHPIPRFFFVDKFSYWLWCIRVNDFLIFWCPFNVLTIWFYPLSKFENFPSWLSEITSLVWFPRSFVC